MLAAGGKQVPTSTMLTSLLAQARSTEHVTLAWLMGHLRERSFGIVLLLLGLLGLAPGVSLIAGILIAIPAIEMILGRSTPTFPRAIALRELPTRRVSSLLGRAIPVLRWLESYVHPRWHLPVQATQRVVGFVVLLLGLSLLIPLPLSNIVPGLIIVAISLAYLQRDGVLLCVSLACAVAALGATAFAAWQAIRLGLRLGL